jgi:hypothetical protein
MSISSKVAQPKLSQRQRPLWELVARKLGTCSRWILHSASSSAHHPTRKIVGNPRPSSFETDSLSTKHQADRQVRPHSLANVSISFVAHASKLPTEIYRSTLQLRCHLSVGRLLQLFVGRAKHSGPHELVFLWYATSSLKICPSRQAAAGLEVTVITFEATLECDISCGQTQSYLRLPYVANKGGLNARLRIAAGARQCHR